MTEARYRGQKVVVVSPDYADHTKFADDWLAANPGTDGALAMAMGHVVLTEFFRDRQVDYFTDYVKRHTDLPFLVTLRERGDAWVPDRFLAADLDGAEAAAEGAAPRDGPAGRGRAAPHSRTARWASVPATRARAGGTSTSATRIHCFPYTGATSGRSRSTWPASTSARPRAARSSAAASRRRGSPTAW